MTIKEFLEEIIRVFTWAGIENPSLEAQLLACHVLSCQKVYLFTHGDEEIDDKVLLASAALINERTAGRPIQYIVGNTDFYGITVAVDERVLIPRPETELLVENALTEIKSVDEESPRILDLCTGSGCIAAAIAANCPDAQVTASELSPKAFMLARVNCRPYSNIRVLRGDLFGSIPEGSLPFHMIVTNPPYVKTGVIGTLAREVKDHEPFMALDGGEDGLDIIRRILAKAPDYLMSGGVILMEIGDDQGAELLQLAAADGRYRNYGIIKDLAKKDRIFRAEV